MIGRLSEDAGCLAALEAALGHAAPFSEEEAAAITDLTVRGARNLAGLSVCTGLARLRLIGCELEDLLVCESLTKLRELLLEGCAVESFTGPSFCERLERVDLLFTSIDNAGDLLGIGAWRRGSILGNPWDATGYAALLAGSDDGRAIELATEADTKACRALWEALRAVCGKIGDREVVVRPGIATLTPHTVDILDVPVSAVRHELRQPEITLEKLFAERTGRVLTDELGELVKARQVGDAADARRWLEEAGDALSAVERAAQERLIVRFPAALYWRCDAASVTRQAAALGVMLPAWYAAQRTILDGWLPHLVSAPVRFDGFVGESPRAAYAAARTFDVGMREPSAELADALRVAGLLPIGVALEDPEHTLAIRLLGEDRAVYEYHEDDLRDALATGRTIDISISKVFPSFSAMLEHVVEIRGYAGG